MGCCSSGYGAAVTTDLKNKNKLGLPELIAMGVGGMIGGGIFSVLGIAVGISGHAAPLAFGLGGLIAMLTGYSYVKLALAFRSDGASFTYLERAFPGAPSVAGLMGWLVIVGYVGTLALYSFTFGAYGAELLSDQGSALTRRVLSVGVLLFFMIVNLNGVRSSGLMEDLIVYTKILLLTLIGIAGLTSTRRVNLLPVFDQGVSSVFIAGAMVFVAFEGFQLITNAVCEADRPERNIPRGIYGSILITSLIYLVVSFVAVGSMAPEGLIAAKEYALAVAAEPALGNAGRVLVGIAALLATSSAINATSFGASRMMAEMSREEMMPKAFSFRSRSGDVPWFAVVALTGMGVLFSVFNSLDTIASFSSLTFLLVSMGVAIANLKLSATTKSSKPLVISGIAVISVTIALLLWHLWTSERGTLVDVVTIYIAVIVAELAFSKRRVVFKTKGA